MVSYADRHNGVEVKRCPPELETRSESDPREMYATIDAFTGCDHLLCLASPSIDSLEYSGRGGLLYEPGKWAVTGKYECNNGYETSS
jgi:hypothetical protein